MESTACRVLLLDDDPVEREALAEYLRSSYRYQVDTAPDGSTALDLAERAGGGYDVALIDELLLAESGTVVLRDLKARWPDIEAILFTGWDSQKVGVAAIRAGAYRFFAKPLDVEELGLTIRQASESARMRRETRILADLRQAATAITSSVDLTKVLEQTCRAAVDLFGVDHSGLVVFNEDQTVGRVRAEYPRHLLRNDPSQGVLEIPVRGVPAEERLVDAQEVLNIPDVAASLDLGPVGAMLVERGIQSILVVPVVLYRRVVASFSLDVMARRRHFTHDEIERCRELATQVAGALRNAWLFDAAEALARANGLDQVLSQILKNATRVTKADYAFLWRYDADRDVFLPEDLAGRNAPAEWLETFRQEEPKTGRTTRSVLESGYLAVPDMAQPESECLGTATRANLTALGVRAFQGIRLAVGDEPLGVLYVDYRQPYPFGDQERGVLEELAKHAALALKRELLLEQVTRARETARVVARVSTLGELQQTVDSVARGTREAIGCDAVTLYVYDPAKHRLGYVAAMVNIWNRDRCAAGAIGADSLVATLMESLERYVVVDRVAEDARFHHSRFAREEQIESCVVLPLHAGATRVGVMFVNYRRPHRFTQDELTNLELYADQTAVAIRNAQLYEDVQRQTATLKALYEAGRTITSTLTLDEILNGIAEHARHIVEHVCHAGGCVAYDGRLADGASLVPSHTCCLSHVALIEDGKMHFMAASPRSILDALREKLGVVDLETAPKIGVAGRCVREGHLFNIRDVRDRAQAPDYIPLTPFVRSQLSVPVRVREGLSVVITIEHPILGAFSAEDEQNLALLGAQAAAAINNARYVEELRNTQSQVGARTTLAWMGMASSTWRHAIDGHALTVEETGYLLRRYLAGAALPPEQRLQIDTLVTRIISVAGKMLEKAITPPLSSEEQVVVMDVNDLLRERLVQLWTAEGRDPATLRRDLAGEALAVKISPEWLRRAIDIVVANAVNALRDRPVQQLTVTTRRIPLVRGAQVEIGFHDTGPGIPAAVQAHLFKDPIGKTEGENGLGLGLLLAQVIVQTYGGDIRVGATGREGTTMLILLPLAT